MIERQSKNPFPRSRYSMANNLRKLEKCTDDELPRKACEPALAVFTLNFNIPT